MLDQMIVGVIAAVLLLNPVHDVAEVGLSCPRTCAIADAPSIVSVA